MQGITTKTPKQISDMRVGGRMLATVLEILKNNTKAGITPKEMAKLAREELNKLGGKPAFLGFEGYPEVICISVNDQVQHSIPSNKPFVDGDIVNYDFGVRYRGLVTDGGISVCVGNKPDKDRSRLLSATEEALMEGISVIRDGCRVGDISAEIEAVLRRNKLGIVRELVGHGVGYELHEEPEIPNYGVAGEGPVLRAGMTLAIEPITTLGDHKIIGDKDGWTLWTADGSLSAQFEHTVAVTKDGCQVLTSL